MLLSFAFLFSPSQSSPFLDSLLRTGLKKYEKILNDPAKYKLRIIYTQINRDRHNKPQFKDYQLHEHTGYVYPASTVKLPVALLALIKLKELNKPGLNRATTMFTDSMFYCQKKINKDSTSASGYPNLENYIKKMFLVSDNYSFARVYEFVGHDYAHQKLSSLGYKEIRLLNRLDGQCPGDTAKITPPVYFLNNSLDTIYKQGFTHFSEKLVHPISNSAVGKSHTNGRGKAIPGPKDFSTHNYFELGDLHRLMKALVFNNYADADKRLPLDEDDRLFMLKQLGLYPGESDFPKYDKKVFYDSFKKYFMYGSAVPVINQDSLRIINIVGRAYGFLIDCAYIVDLKNNIEFLLTACVYVNESGRVGAGRYEYEQLGLPFFKDLSLCLYNYERTRPKKHAPDLIEFKNLF